MVGYVSPFNLYIQLGMNAVLLLTNKDVSVR